MAVDQLPQELTAIAELPRCDFDRHPLRFRLVWGERSEKSPNNRERDMTSETVVYQAKKIITMNSYQPEATHVAVRDGRILGVGNLDDLSIWRDFRLDNQFADKVLMPGFVEGHCHLMEGNLWRYTYVGYTPRIGPDGKKTPELKSTEDIVTYLRDVDAGMDDPAQPLVAWGLDPIYFDGPRLSRRDLDQVSTTRNIVILHSNLHLATVNSAVLDAAGVDRTTNVVGVAKDDNGEPNGELQEMAAMFMAMSASGVDFVGGMADDTTLSNFEALTRRVGVTTATDLFNGLTDDVVASLTRWFGREDCSLRLVPTLGATLAPVEQSAERALALKAKSTDKLRMGIVKFVLDGSIQGFTARLKWPGYLDGRPNGIWNDDPNELEKWFGGYHRAGVQMFIHANGDETSEVALDALEQVMRDHAWPDHRHTLQHVQMADEAQFRKMSALGVCANLFSNHAYYWGDEHWTKTIGPDRAKRMNAAATAKRHGVNFAIHSDAPVTPIGPLFTAWCAVNRLTMSGRVLGEEECISVDDALRTITLGAAYTLKMDREIGSIESGKLADFAVLEVDPYDVGPRDIKDIPVWGTVVGGRVFPADV